MLAGKKKLLLNVLVLFVVSAVMVQYMVYNKRREPVRKLELVDTLQYSGSLSQLMAEGSQWPGIQERKYIKPPNDDGIYYQQPPNMMIFSQSVENSDELPDSQEPHMTVEQLDDLAQAANSINPAGETLLLTLTGQAILELTLNWLCDTADLGVQPQTLIITTDQVSYDRIHNRWPRVHLWEMPSKLLASHSSTKFLLFYTLAKVQLSLGLITRNVSFLLFETDATWLQNPLPLINKFKKQGYEIVTARASSPDSSRMSAAFMFLNASPGSSLILQTVSDIINKREDDVVVEEKIETMCKEGKANCSLFSWYDIADSNWFNLNVTEQRSFKPYVINSDQTFSITKKKKAAMTFRHWFITKGGTCSVALVSKFFAKVNEGIIPGSGFVIRRKTKKYQKIYLHSSLGKKFLQ